MRFECDSCHAKYQISDEKVRGRVVRFPCRKCDHKILIDGRGWRSRRHRSRRVRPTAFDEVTRTSEPASRRFGHEAPTARARRPGFARSPPFFVGAAASAVLGIAQVVVATVAFGCGCGEHCARGPPPRLGASRFPSRPTAGARTCRVARLDQRRSRRVPFASRRSRTRSTRAP